MKAKDVGFWVAPNDSHFWLDQHRYKEYVSLKKELAQLEAMIPIAVETPPDLQRMGADTSLVHKEIK